MNGESFAIVNVDAARESNGKILVLIDDRATAEEFAADLTERGCAVEVRRAVCRRGIVVLAGAAERRTMTFA